MSSFAIDSHHLQWRHGVSNHRQFDILFNSFLILTSREKKLKLNITGPLRGESIGDSWIPHTEDQ